MCFCFATGSNKMENGRPALEVLDYIEYLTYDFEGLKIFVTGDFFVQNNSADRQRLYGLHGGNIEFDLSTDEWLTDTRWTKILDNVAGPKIGLEITKDNRVFLHKITGNSIEVKLVINADDFFEWGPERPGNANYTYFSAWQSPELEPGKCSLIRVTGIIEGDSYYRVLPDKNDKIIITGGAPLLNQIYNELQTGNLPHHEEYQKHFDEFKNMFQPMSFYNIFFEGSNLERFKFINGSTDVYRAKSNMQIDGRRINWYWSNTDHYTLKSQAKGPQLVLALC